ncbi:MAG: hypothetical protein GX094_03410 [Clostridiales bacterium]|jgi:hypothetical protein|nr:hypothetical protein [Clostridiales bacterium]
MVRVSDNKISVETGTLEAKLENGHFVYLKSKITGDVFVNSNDSVPALELVYNNNEAFGIGEMKFGNVDVFQLSDTLAEIRLSNWDGDGVITVSEDPETHDLLIKPSAYSSRPGVKACRWNISGIRSDLQLVAPFFQGVKLDLNDSLIKNTHWEWPVMWEAGLAILQGEKSGFWVHCRDTQYRYKALAVGRDESTYSLGFETEAYGPFDNNLAAGGIEWRINVYEGDWEVPASAYRDWLWEAYNLKKQESRRKEWFYDIKMAISWCPTDINILESLSKKVDPKKVIIHLPHWRPDRYDTNYPTYIPTKEAIEFIEKGKELGYYIMPHCNSMEVDPLNPVYDYVRDFQFRDAITKRIRGWSWYEGKWNLEVPNSNAQLKKHRDKLLMTKIHPGLSMWRHILSERIYKAVTELDIDTIFIDITLNTFNLNNCLVENTTSTEGMKLLIDQVGNLYKGLAVGGEGLNEITMQGLSFAQSHLFKSWQNNNIEGLERTGGCPLNAFMFDKLCKSIGYSYLSGETEFEEIRMKVDEGKGVLPTITFPRGKDPVEFIERPNKMVKMIFEKVNG